MGIKNSKCKYHPCHKNLEDCSFCYCPLFPCKDKKRGKWHKGVWDCSDCKIIHNKKFVNLARNYLNHLIEVLEYQI